jgi:hypothetical protein
MHSKYNTLIPLFLGIGIFLFCTQSYSQLPSYLPTNGLIAWYPFNGNANDESGNGNNGSFTGKSCESCGNTTAPPTLTSDRNGISGASYYFSPNFDLISIPNTQSLQLTTSFTISMWLNPNQGNYGQGPGYLSILQKWGGSGSGASYMIALSPLGKPILYTNNSATTSTLVGNSSITLGNWTHVLFTFHNGNATVYLNGIADNTSTALVTPSVQPSSIEIGRNLNQFANYAGDAFTGLVDDISIYNRALSEAEIQGLYTGQPTPTHSACLNLPANLQQGLVGYWPFCGNANDESGNGNNGVVNGATLTTDRFGNANAAYGYDGNSQFIEILNSPSLNPTSISISGWMNASAFATDVAEGSKAIITKWFQAVNCSEQGDNYSVILSIQENENRILGVTSINNAAISAISSSSIGLNSWNHFVFAHDENEGDSFYLNGSLINQNSMIGALCPTTNNLIFGADNVFSNYWRFFAGSIDDIGIWNRALTPEEITTLYTTSNPNGGGDSNGGSGSVAGNTPPGIPYQAEVRNESGEVLANANVNVRFTLHELTANGTLSYQETHTITTNELGLFAATIGAGTATQGTFAGINWAQTTKFLQVEVDAGIGYITMGNQQLMSVPYAQYAQKARKLETQGLPVFENNAQALAGGLQVGALYRTSLGDLKVVY